MLCFDVYHMPFHCKLLDAWVNLYLFSLKFANLFSRLEVKPF